MEPVAMVGWSGRGRFDDLEKTALHKLAAAKRGAGRVDGTLIVAASDPVFAARRLAFLPGVAWIAVGYRFSGTGGYLGVLSSLAKRYVSKGGTFRISAQTARSTQSPGDLVLAGNSELLSSVARSRVDERKPQVRFHVCLEGTRGACGAEIRAGPGGAPTGGDWASCLVSGGERSSSMAWLAALSGLSVRLVHSRTDAVAMRHVARLYSELSFRMDPRCLELVLLSGDGSPVGRLGGWLHDHREVTFAGLKLAQAGSLAAFAGRFPNLAFPLVLFPDDSIDVAYRSLEIGRPAAKPAGGRLTLKALEVASPYSESRFGGVQADSNAVIDALNRG